MTAQLAPLASDVNTVALVVLIALFLLVTVLGFMATRFRRGDGLDTLDEWGLGGRKFGTWVTWFLLGGDLYTAYTFVAVPAAMFATGAVAGFFAVPYTIILYPIIFIFMARLWSVSHRHGYVTTADFVRGRYDARGLSLAVAVTGFIATMPYIALQLVGIQAVLEVVGHRRRRQLARQGPAAVHRVRGARRLHLLLGPAGPRGDRVRQGHADLPGDHRRDHLPARRRSAAGTRSSARPRTRWPAPTRPPARRPGRSSPATASSGPTPRSALGSALALFMYPHSVTASLSSGSRNTIRRNAAILPAYSFVLGLLALLGWVAIAAGTQPIGLDGEPNPQLVIPQLFEDFFPDWFAGVAFAAIAIGALVPAAIMSIAAANTFTRNIYKEWLKKDATPEPGGQGLQADVAAGEGVRAGVRAHARQPERASTSSCSAGSGSCRRSPRSCSASTRGGSTGGRCSRAGRSAWSTAPSPPTA